MSRDEKIRELNRLCERELLPEIARFDSKRQSAKSKTLLAVTVAAGGAICHYGSTGGLDISVIIILGVLVGGLGVWSWFDFAEFRSAFKHQIMIRVVQSIFPGFEYSSEKMIQPGTYEYSQLFPRSYDRYTGEDYCRGRVRETDIEFSELHTEYKVRSNKRTHWVTIFQGVFIHADFHKDLKGRTFVVPDTAEKLLGSWLGGLLQDAASAVGSRGSRVRLENPEFERLFAVTATDPQEARYVLTPAMQEKILSLRQKFRTTPYLSFIGGQVFIGLGDQKDFLEPHFWRALEKRDLFRIFAIFCSITEIVDDLDLNTRIWSKT